MNRVKTIGIVLSALSVLVSAGKSIVKFIDHIDKLKRQSAKYTA